MTPSRWPRLKEIFDEALERNPAERPAFLLEVCKGDDSLRAEIESLLNEQNRVGNFLENCAIGLKTSFVGQEILHYRVIEKIGEGGMGLVYKAMDTRLDRFVALKLLAPGMTADPDMATVARARLLDEARMAAALSHSNIAAVFDVGEWSGAVYIAQELAPGRDLKKIIAETGPLPLQRTVKIARQVCDGLSHAHANGIVHRDIKPANIVVDEEDRVKITDFGLAQRRPKIGETASSIVVGTPGYMAPEQLRARRVDARADQFSVGCTLYEMLTGQPAFPGDSVVSIIESTLHSSPASPSHIKEDVPRALDRLLARALQKDPEDRYENIGLLAQDILNYQRFEYLTNPNSVVKGLVNALQARQALLLLGNHLPVNVNQKRSATVDELVADHLGSQLEVRVNVNHRNVAKIAQDLEFQRGRSEMLRHLKTAVRNPAISAREVLRRIARLPFSVIVTTAYDNFLSEELARIGRAVCGVPDCHKVPDDPFDQELLVWLLGNFENEESLVVTEDDLWEFFRTFHSLSDSLKSAFTQRTLLLLGHDGENEGFRHLVSEIMRFRAGGAGGCYLVAPEFSLSTVRWSESRKLGLVEADLGEFLSLLDEALVETRQHKLATELEPDRPLLPSRPYKFLNYYESSDECIFFGRKTETSRLASKIHAYPLNLFYAASGSGKTSLICAGLAPSLSREGYVPVYTRVYDDPEREIRRASIEACGDIAKGLASDLPLPELLRQLAERAGKRLVIFVDQFEEIFIRYDHLARDQFVAVLDASLNTAKGSVRFVLCLREDFLARISEFRDRIPTIFHNEFRMDPLTEAAASEAITEPAKLLGMEVEPALVDKLIGDLSACGIDPPQLQIVCDTLFDKLEAGEKRLTLKSYLALGGTRKILGDYMERVLRELSPEEREPARTILKCLVTSENTKSVSRIADLVRRAGRSDEEVSRILSNLSNRRLMRRLPRDEDTWYELTHEYLVEEIGKWLSETEKELRKVRELLEQAVRNHRNLGILMPKAQIRLIQAHEDDLNLSKEERQILRQSEQALQSRRTVAAVVGIAAVLFLLGCGVLGRYFYLRSHIFIKSEDRELIEYFRRSKRAVRVEGLRVFAGSPLNLWLDGRLGFPKRLYNTDVELDELDPERRDQVKAGIVFPRTFSIDDEIERMLAPDALIRSLMVKGNRNEALKHLGGIFNNPSIDQETIDDLLGFLGQSGVADASIIPDAMRHAFSAGNALGRPQNYAGIADLLRNVPEAVWRPPLMVSLANPTSRVAALRILGSIGTREDARHIKPYVEEVQEPNVTEQNDVSYTAIKALRRLGDCTALPLVRRLVFESQLNTPPQRVREGIRYISACGDQSDLSRLEGPLLQLVAREDGKFILAYVMGKTLPNIYSAYDRRALPLIRRVLTLLPWDDEDKIQAIDRLPDAISSDDLRSSFSNTMPPAVRARVVAVISELGETSGLNFAFETTLNPNSDEETRSNALKAFSWFRGAPLRSGLLSILRNTHDVSVREAVYSALRWYDDDETFSKLLEGLGDQDANARHAALNSFAFAGSDRARQFLEKKLPTLAPGLNVYAAEALQMMGNDRQGSVFLDYLSKHAETSKDYDAVVTAIQELSHYYQRQPIPIVVDGLRSPNREVRLAATLGLTHHREPALVVESLSKVEAEREPQFQLAVRRAQWAVGVCARARRSWDLARQALSAGDYRSSFNLIGGLDSEAFPPSCSAALSIGLSANKVTRAGNMIFQGALFLW